MHAYAASDKMAPQESIDIQDDGEYENLPFHGMANAPNKVCCNSYHRHHQTNNSTQFSVVVFCLLLV